MLLAGKDILVGKYAAAEHEISGRRIDKADKSQ
jgi:hypothetical protein